jgi:hypothetical protein
MGNFIIPDWAAPQPVPPPPQPDPRVAREEKIANDTRVESELNRFIASKQHALFNTPDAFYRTEGVDAIHAAPVATQNLEQLRSDLLDGLANDYQRKRLGAALNAQMQVTRQQMARHVAEQSLAWQRQTAQDRIALLTKEAAYHHNDTDLVDSLGRAAANAARAHARVGDVAPDSPVEEAAAATARSAVLSSAIRARFDKGDRDGADALLTQVKDHLDPAHAAPLQARIDAALSEALDAKPFASALDTSLQVAPGSIEEAVANAAVARPPDQALNAPNNADAGSSPPESPKTWDELSFGEKLVTVLRRFNLEGEARGAAFGVDSTARHLQQVEELQKRKAAGEELDVAEERFILKNRNAAEQLAGSVGRLVGAQKRLGELPRSAALSQLLEAPTFGDALVIARKNPGAIAAAFSLESAPDALVGLAALAALGPVAGGAVLTGTAGAQGYASGLIGALSMEGVDLTDSEQLKRALRDNDLMRRVRARAGTQAAIDAGAALAMAVLTGRAGKVRPGVQSKAATTQLESANNAAPRPHSTARLSPAEQLPINIAAGKKAEEKIAGILRENRNVEFAQQVTLKTRSGKKTRIDFIIRDLETGKVWCIEVKASEAARLSTNQRRAFLEIEEGGATIVGRGKPLFPGKTVLGPTPVKIIRNP